VSRKACGANLGDSGGNKGKEHIVVGAASGSSGRRREEHVEQMWVAVVTKARSTLSLEL
jgi:hypothetical protein